MRRAIREHLRDFIAILTLLVLGLAAPSRSSPAAGGLPVLDPVPRRRALRAWAEFTSRRR